MPAKNPPSKSAKAKPKAKTKELPVREIPITATATNVRPKEKTPAAPAFGKTNKITAVQKARPLSPHLQIYRWQITMSMSILHRATGVALYVGAFVLAALFVSLSYGAEVFGQAVSYINHPLGQIAIAGWVFCLFYHFLNGIRHLVWDSGHGFLIREMNFTGWLVVILSLALTAAALAFAHPECVQNILGNSGV